MKKSLAKKVYSIVTILFFLYVQQFQLSYSATIGIKNNLSIALPWTLLNMLFVSLPFFVILLIVKSVKQAVLANIVLVTILSMLNYHVLVFHGAPFLAGDIFSIPTALNVISEYDLVWDHIVKRLLIIFGAEIIVWFLIFCVMFNKKMWGGIPGICRRISAMLVALSLGSVVVLFFSPIAIFDRSLFSWSWGPAMNQYGYGVCFLNSIYAITHFYAEPEGYDAKHIVCNGSDSKNVVDVKSLPDIVLILNETLADLSVYADVKESQEIFGKLDAIDGIISGYTTSSLIGGGTNNSEYELLTSNSMQVLVVSAPFLSLDMANSQSVVSYLGDLDYTTVGMHCGNATNYNRNNAYKQMGFDEIRLGKEGFEYFGKNGNRPWLDCDNYRDMLQVYEECGDNPRFMYLLTYQNHGGYEQNDAAEDTISIAGNYGDRMDDINEYLTSIDQSVDAFIGLIQYFENSERDVVVMMLGDHAPAFISNIASNKGMTGKQQAIAKLTVPYYVWSNTEIDSSVFSGYASMVDLMPLLFKSLKMPLTGYYRTITDLNKMVPIRTSTGHYMDASGTIGEIMPEYEHYNAIQNYYYLEYNNLIQGDDYRPEWFELSSAEITMNN